MNGTNVGTAYMTLSADDSMFRKQINTNASFAQNTLGGAFKKIGGIVAAAFAVTKIVQFGKECLDLGSDLTEVQNVVDVSFPKMTGQVDNFAKNAATQFGLSETMAKKFTGTFGAMSKAFGFAEKDSYSMATALTGLAGDVASFYNISQDEAYTKLKSVYTGETETLKDLGVVMTQNALDQYALANGYGKTTAKMTEQEKVALRFAFVQKQLALASGDFSRTSDSWANQTRILKLNFDSLKASIGQGLINVFTPIIKGINGLMSKLKWLADGFKNFTSMIFGNASRGDTGANVVGDLAGSADEASNSVSDIGESAKKTKKQLLGLRSIDAINNLSTSGDGGESGSTSIPDPGFSNIEKDIQNTSGFMDKLINKTKEWFDTFKNGFKEGLGGANFDNIKKSLGGIKDAIIDIWSDPNVKNAANTWASNVILNFGKVIGSIASIGITIAENLLGGAQLFLNQNSESIKQHIIRVFDISSKAHEISGNFAVAIADIFSVFRSPQAKQITADIIAIFYEGFMGVFEIVGRVGTDIMDIVTGPIIANKDLIKTALTEMFGPLSIVLGTIKTGIQDTFTKFWEVYETYIAPSVASIKSGLSSILEVFLNVWNNNISPILDNWGAKFSTLWQEHLQPMVNNLLVFIGKLIDGWTTLWKTWIQPFVEWVVANVIPVLAPIFETLGNIFMTVFGVISDVIGGIFKALGGLVDFIVGVFTGDWDKAWSGIKNIFGGIWDAIKGILQGIADIFMNIWNGIKDFVINIWNSISNTASNVWNGISGFLGNIWNGISGAASNIFNNIANTVSNVFNNIRNFISNIWNTITSVISGQINNVWNVITNILNNIKNTWDNIWSTLGNAVSNAFNGIWNGIKHVANSILGGIEGMVNGVIRGINRLISGLNSVSSIIGISFGQISPVSLPRLAQGGYVKANTPQLAMIGDNRHQGEIVAPENKLHSIMAEELSKFKGTGNSNEVISLLKEILKYLRNLGGDTVLNVDNIELARAVIKGMKLLQAKSDKPILDFI